MMKRTIRFILVASLILALLVGNSWVTGASFADGESSIGNVLRAWISSMWVQTTQSDFEAGVPNQVNTTYSPGDVRLGADSSTITDTFNDETMIASKSNLVVTGGQVKLSGGSVQTETLRPSAAGDETGVPSQYPSSGEHWDKVDEVSSDSDSTYVYNSSFSWGEDLYNIADHSVGTGTINYIKVYMVCRATSSTSTTCAYTHIKTGTTEDNGTAVVADTVYTTYSYQWDNNPETSTSWTWDEIDALQIGVGLRRPGAGGGSKSTQCTQVYVEVNYTSGYDSPGTLTSTNLLSGQTVTSIDSFDYNASAIPSGTTMKVQFSQDSTNWYNSSGSAGGWDTLSQGSNSINLSGLGWSGENFYYRMEFTSDGVTTPLLNEISVNFSLGYYSSGTISSQVLDTGTGADWYDADWSYRREISIDHTEVQDVADPSTTYANFPVLVYATSLSNINVNGTDIRFTTSDGTTELPREIESYVGGTLYAWVKVTLTKDSSDSTDDVIYMYYGNASATEPPEDSTYGSENVWDSSYKGVWHLKEDPGPGGTGDIKDSTSNDSDGTALPGMTSDDLVDTQIYKGYDLDEDGDGVDSGMPSNCATNVTMSVWFKADDAGSIGDDSVAQRLITQLRAITSSRFALGISNNRIATYWYDGADNTQEGTTTLTSTPWYYATVTYDGSYIRLYLNGIEENSWSESSMASPSTDTAQIGRGASNDRFFDGLIDEVSVSDIAHTAEWIKNCYNNQEDPSGFCDVKVEEDLDSIGSIWIALSWDETLQSNTDITFEVRASKGSFAKGDASLSWIPVGGTSPVTSGLPSGRYMQWRATLTSSDPTKTPTLHEVIVFYD